MDETFGCDYVDVKPKQDQSDVSLTRIGWGTFKIPITVYWNNCLMREESKFEHYLRFRKDGS